MQKLEHCYATIAIVAHDAGAANHIQSWLKTGYLDASKVNLYVDGPATKIFNNINPRLRSNSLEQVLDGASFLISGTGWASSFEHNARVLACERKIKTIAVIDHWTNYRERFFRAGKEMLPDEVWVVDEYALELAKKKLPGVKVVCHGNDYIKLQVQEIEKFSNNKKESLNTHVLFLMEPIRQKWGISNIPGEMQSFEYFINNMALLGVEKDAKIIIKPHPSDDHRKYESWITKYRELCIEIDSSSSLAQLIARSDVVVGMQTYAMVVAVAVGKKVVSSMPLCAPKCTLPQEEIIHLSKYYMPN